MRVQVLRRPAPVQEALLEASTRPLPLPGAGEVRIRIPAYGICHTDLHIVDGDLPARRLPVVPDHQIVGIVEEAGEGVAVTCPGKPRGDRLALDIDDAVDMTGVLS